MGQDDGFIYFYFNVNSGGGYFNKKMLLCQKINGSKLGFCN
jgi:hypothetical protein